MCAMACVVKSCCRQQRASTATFQLFTGRGGLAEKMRGNDVNCEHTLLPSERTINSSPQ